MGGPQDLSGRMRNISPTPALYPRTFHPVACRYSDCFTVPLLYSSGMLNDAHWKQYTDISKYRTAWISVLLSCVNTRYSFSTSCSSPLYPLQSDSVCVSRWAIWLFMYSYVNILKPTVNVMHHQFNIQQLYAQPTLYLCALYLSENKQRLVSLTA